VQRAKRMHSDPRPTGIKVTPLKFACTYVSDSGIFRLSIGLQWRTKADGCCAALGVYGMAWARKWHVVVSTIVRTKCAH